MEQLASRFNRCTLRNDAENVANLAADLGEEGVQYLRSTLRGGSTAEAVEMVGLLCKLDARSVEVFLPARMKEFPRNSQDRVLRQISASGSPGRCRILLGVLDLLDPLVMSGTRWSAAACAPATGDAAAHAQSYRDVAVRLPLRRHQRGRL